MIPVLIAGAIAGAFALIGTPFVISYFRTRGFGQMIREEGPQTHRSKAGTPTMGGTAIVLSAVVGYLGAHLGGTDFTYTGALVLLTMIGMGVVGFADDFIKLRHRRNLGLNKTTKFLGQAIIAATFAFVGPAVAGIERNISVVGNLAVEIPAWAFFIWVFLLLSGASNAVNLTDGLDGLAAGSGALVFGAYTLIAFWIFRNPGTYDFVPTGDALDVAIILAAVTAACGGFLWHNAPPARIFMGDTGSLALGGLLAATAIVTNTQLLLVLLGGLYVVETLSVILQIAVFRTTGKRLFRMAPIHHHFELLGWQEATIIVRFWIIASVGVVLGLGGFYGEWFARVGEL